MLRTLLAGRVTRVDNTVEHTRSVGLQLRAVQDLSSEADIYLVDLR